MMVVKLITLLVVCASLQCDAKKSTSREKQFNLNQQTCDACPNTKFFNTINITLEEYISNSPFIVYRISKNYPDKDVVSQCFTYLNLGPGVYLYILANAFKDGTITVNLYFFIDGPFKPGTFWIVGLAGRKQPFTPAIFIGNSMQKLTTTDNATVFSAITVDVAAGCQETPAVLDPVLIYGDSTTPDECSILSAKNNLKSIIGGLSYFKTSNKCPIPCVADIYGIKVVNSDRLSNNPNIKRFSYPSMQPYMD